MCGFKIIKTGDWIFLWINVRFFEARSYQGISGILFRAVIKPQSEAENDIRGSPQMLTIVRTWWILNLKRRRKLNSWGLDHLPIEQSVMGGKCGNNTKQLNFERIIPRWLMYIESLEFRKQERFVDQFSKTLDAWSMGCGHLSSGSWVMSEVSPPWVRDSVHWHSAARASDDILTSSSNTQTVAASGFSSAVSWI